MEDDINKLFDQVFSKSGDLSVVKSGIPEFLDQLNLRPNDLELFKKTLGFFLYYHRPILSIDERHIVSVTNFTLIITFSLIEGVMQSVPFMDFVAFLNSKAQEPSGADGVNKKELLLELSKEYSEKYGAIRKVKCFFENYVSISDQNIILSHYENGKYSDIKKVISSIYKIRSEFVHDLGFDKLMPISGLIEIVPGASGAPEAEIVQTLDIKDFVIIIWSAVLKKFGFDEKKLNTL